MLKKFLIILAAFSIIACSGRKVDISKKQERGGIVYIVNEQKPFSGVITGKYGNGQVESKADFENGVAKGTYFQYHRNGEVSYTGQFINGKRQGEWNRYTDDKKLILTEFYNNGTLEDVKQYLVDTDKVKQKILDFFN